MKISLDFIYPSENPGFVEYNRAFVVEGNIYSDTSLMDGCLLTIKLIDENNDVVRQVNCDKKNKDFLLYYDGFTTYKEELDVKHQKLKEFGFVPLIVNDISNIDESIHDATIKCWYNDKCFKAMFVSASNKQSGAIFDDGMNLLDENGKPYTTLKQGNYVVEVTLSYDDSILAKANKNIIIGKRKDQLICRFNPLVHKNRMIKWANENNYAIINDLLPGYLDSYLGTWYYHMGLLKMYRANDIALFVDTCVRMFVYLIDSSSTSYETELAYLQTQNVINDTNRFVAYHYDIGEAKIQDQIGKIVKFNEDEIFCVTRIDLVNDLAIENVFNLNQEAIIDSIFDLNNININGKFALAGVIKPWQMNPNDFVLKDDNTYQILNCPDKIRYAFDCDGHNEVIMRSTNLERIDNISIGNSVFEFYNVFDLKDEWKHKNIKLKLELIDKHNEVIDTKYLELKVD